VPIPIDGFHIPEIKTGIAIRVIYQRSKAGFEAFNTDDRSIGLFAAVNAKRQTLSARKRTA
jgi:hypothetical protein